MARIPTSPRTDGKKDTGCPSYILYEFVSRQKAKKKREEAKRLKREQRLADPPTTLTCAVVQSFRAKVETEARRRGMTVSEFMRKTLEKELSDCGKDEQSGTNETTSSND